MTAQQDPQYTQYMYNMAVVNPAYAGSRTHWSFGVLYRNQWTGLQGAPETGTIFAHKAVSEQWGLGASLIVDQAGPVTETNAYADLAYTLNFNKDRRLAFGLKLGATFHDIGLSNLTVFDPDDPFFSENVSSVTPNFGAGVFYYTNRFYAGFSVPNLLEATHLNVNGILLGSETQHFFLTSGMVFPLSEKVVLKPSFLLKSAFGAPLSLDLNVNTRLYDRLELGVSYRTDDSVSGLINFQITRTLRIGYAYDYILSEINPFGASSSELIILLDILPIEKRMKSPRFF
jgi:type IX secretion system PorP/SprF family membrane protein